MRYVENHKGVRELAQSSGIGDACYEAGKLVEAAARATPIPGASARQLASYRARFGTRRGPVTMAKNGEVRAGAFVYNDHELEYVFGSRARTLYSAITALDGVSIE